jgi:predicted metalloprotease
MMRWDDFRRSDNVEDRRDDDPSESGGFGGARRAGGLGIGTIVVLGLVGWALGIDPRLLIGGAEILTGGDQSAQAPPASQRPTGTPDDQVGQFVAAVLGDTEDRWTEILQPAGVTYQAPKLVMFSGSTTSACGFAQAAMGPFYCPNDQKVYLDTSFFQEIETRFGGCQVGSSACRFSQAYVITHEVGHHVQNLLGILSKAQDMQREMSKVDANHLQVRIELQADCFAGVWANRSQQKLKFLDPGDIDAALQTASAIGDDRLQKQAQGYVVPDAFTHGSSEQRKRWFTAGFNSGSPGGCNTFEAAQL